MRRIGTTPLMNKKIFKKICIALSLQIEIFRLSGVEAARSDIGVDK